MGRGAGKALGRGSDVGLRFEEIEKVFDVKRLLGDIVETRKQRFDQGTRAREGPGDERETAHRHDARNSADQDQNVSSVIARRRQQIQQRSSDGALDRQRLVFLVEPIEKNARAVCQVIAEAENFHFLGALVACAQHAQIIQLAALGGPAVEHRVGQHREAGFAQKRRNHGRYQEHQKPR